MKKVKLTTITLALIASSAVAPLAANAEEVVSFDVVTEEGTAAEVEEVVAPVSFSTRAADAAGRTATQGVTDLNAALSTEAAKTLVYGGATAPEAPTFAEADFVTLHDDGTGAEIIIDDAEFNELMKKVTDYNTALAEFNALADAQTALKTAIDAMPAGVDAAGQDKAAFESRATTEATTKAGADALLVEVQAFTPITELEQLILDAEKEADAALAAKAISQEMHKQVKEDLRDPKKVDSKLTIDMVMAPVRDAVKLQTRKATLKLEIQNLTTSGSLLAGDAIALQLELAAADTKEKVDAVEAKMEAARELQKTKDAGYDAITTLVTLGAIKPARAAYYKGLISKARTPEEVEAILAAAAKDDNVIFDKAVAEEILHVLHKDGLITDADYTLYLLDLSEAKDEATVANIVTNARNIAAAREAAKATLLDALAAGKITKTQYENAIKRIEAARYQSEIDAILAEYGLKADDTKTEPKPKPKPEPGKDKEDEGKEPGKKDEGKAPGKDNKGSKPAVVTTSAKATLPQTGEELNGSIVAGGLMSMLTAAFLFFRRDRKAD